MVKIIPKKRLAARAQASAPEPLTERAKKEEDKKVDLASVPRYREASLKQPTPLENLEKIYSRRVFNEIMKPARRPRITPSDSGIPAVYVVSYAQTGERVSEEAGIVGTYSTAEAANIQVMTFFNEEYPEITQKLSDSGWTHIKKFPGHQFDSVTYWIDKDNCLQLFCEEQINRRTVRACKQDVRTDGFDKPFPRSPKTPKIGDMLTPEEAKLQEHLMRGFRHDI